MKKSAVLCCLLGAATFCGAEVTHRFMANCVSQGKARLVNPSGETEWEMKGLRTIQDSWLLENGNYLFSHKTGVKEVTPAKDVVWEYRSPEGVELHSAQPIEDGKVLACECGTKRLIEIDRKGTIVKEIALQSDNKLHTQFRTARKTARGTYWVAFIGQGKVKELDADGKMIRELKVANGHKHAHGIQELPNGNVLVSTADGGEVKEFDSNGALVWHLSKADMLAAGVVKVAYAAGIERLPNGNTLVSMYFGNPQFFEVTPDKKMVWSFHNPSFGNVAGFRLLDEVAGE